MRDYVICALFQGPERQIQSTRTAVEVIDSLSGARAFVCRPFVHYATTCIGLCLISETRHCLFCRQSCLQQLGCGTYVISDIVPKTLALLLQMCRLDTRHNVLRTREAAENKTLVVVTHHFERIRETKGD